METVGRIEELSGLGHCLHDLQKPFFDLMQRHAYACKLTEIKSKDTVHVAARSRSSGGFSLSRVTTTGSMGGQMRRDKEDIARDLKDEFALYLSLKGDCIISQYGRDQKMRPRKYTLLSMSDPLHFETATSYENDVVSFCMPQNFVDQRIASGERICVRDCDGKQGLQPLVLDTVSAFNNIAWTLSDHEFAAAAGVLGDLIVLALGNSVDLRSYDRPVRVANLNRAKRIIRRRMADPNLTLSDVAHECGLSLDYIHTLFRYDGQSIREYLKQERLNRARNLLERLDATRGSVTDIALECGFQNVAHFSTSFKATFGLSPRDVLRRKLA